MPVHENSLKNLKPIQKGERRNPNGRPKKTAIFEKLGVVPYDAGQMKRDIHMIAAMQPKDRIELASIGVKNKNSETAWMFRGVPVTSHQVMVARQWGSKQFMKLYEYLLPKPEKTIEVKTKETAPREEETRVFSEEDFAKAMAVLNENA